MENIFRLLLGFGFIVFVGYLVYQIFVQASSDTYVRLTNDLAEVQAGNNAISEKNDLLRVRIEALRSDPRAIERKVRDELEMARPDEVIILFKSDNPPEIPTEPETVQE
ncbi:MAG: septum formation initiator family protein [Proteobacteria bacterium]|nr:septum formation initiator family protein [Pseudomonadota bacterium]